MSTMKLGYNVNGKDAGHIKTKESPQSRGGSVNNVGFTALYHVTPRIQSLCDGKSVSSIIPLSEMMGKPEESVANQSPSGDCRIVR